MATLYKLALSVVTKRRKFTCDTLGHYTHTYEYTNLLTSCLAPPPVLDEVVSATTSLLAEMVRQRHDANMVKKRVYVCSGDRMTRRDILYC